MSKIHHINENVSQIRLTDSKNIAHRVTCIVSNEYKDGVIVFLKSINVVAYVESGRVIRQILKPRGFGFVGNRINLHSTLVNIIKFVVPIEHSKAVMECIANIVDMDIPGHGSIYAQEILVFGNIQHKINLSGVDIAARPKDSIKFLSNMTCVTCVMSNKGSGEQLAQMALELGICVPTITFGAGNDIRDQLGLIRITIPIEKEVVQLVMHNQDVKSLVPLIAEEAKLEVPGKGYMYQSPLFNGLFDTRMKIGRQSHAATTDQIIAAIDNINNGTTWRKRFDLEIYPSLNNSIISHDNHEISIITEEDRLDEYRKTFMNLGAIGSLTTQVYLISCEEENDEFENNSFVRADISISDHIVADVLNALVELRSKDEFKQDTIQISNLTGAVSEHQVS